MRPLYTSQKQAVSRPVMHYNALHPALLQYPQLCSAVPHSLTMGSASLRACQPRSRSSLTSPRSPSTSYQQQQTWLSEAFWLSGSAALHLRHPSAWKALQGRLKSRSFAVHSFLGCFSGWHPASMNCAEPFSVCQLAHIVHKISCFVMSPGKIFKLQTVHSSSPFTASIHAHSFLFNPMERLPMIHPLTNFLANEALLVMRVMSMVHLT